MTQEDLKKKFPKYFPVNKLPVGVKEQNIEVYRMCKWGLVERKAFYSNYEEAEILGMKLKGYSHEHYLSDIDKHSVSSFEKQEDAKSRLKLFTRHKPKCIIAKGITSANCGPSQRTSERKKCKDSHIDWWIYENAEPHLHFSEVKL